MRVLIVAQSQLAAANVRQALRYVPGHEIVGWVHTMRPCGAAIEAAAPDVVLLDQAGAVGGAILERGREIRRRVRHAKLILLAECLDGDALADAAAAGIDAAVSRGAGSSRVGLLVSEIFAGHVFHLAPVPRRNGHTRRTADLTPRELEILRLVAGGMSNHSIAGALYVTEQTVKFHLSNVYRKLGLANRTQASHYAYVNGLVQPTAYDGHFTPDMPPALAA